MVQVHKNVASTSLTGSGRKNRKYQRQESNTGPETLGTVPISGGKNQKKEAEIKGARRVRGELLAKTGGGNKSRWEKPLTKKGGREGVAEFKFYWAKSKGLSGDDGELRYSGIS